MRVVGHVYTAHARLGMTTDKIACVYSSDDPPASTYRPIELRLAEPLGERGLVGAISGHPIGMLDPAYSPEPTYLPDGYELTQVDHFTPDDGFIALRQYQNSKVDASIEIRVRSHSAWRQYGKVLSHEEVDGEPAEITLDYERCLSWSPRRGLVFEVCDDLPRTDPRTTATLLRVARSIPQPPEHHLLLGGVSGKPEEIRAVCTKVAAQASWDSHFGTWPGRTVAVLHTLRPSRYV